MTMRQMYPAAVNSPGTELTADITATDTEITVLSTSVLPPAPNLLTIGSDETAETVRYTTVEGDVLTVERGFQGVAKAWSAGTKIARNFTAYDHDAFVENIESHVFDYIKHPGFGVASGSNNAYVVTLVPAPSTYAQGMGVAIAIHANSTAAATLNVNGLGAKKILKANGGDVTNLKANGIYTLRYNPAADGGNGAFILQGEGGEYGNATVTDVLSGKTIGTETGIVTGTMPNNGVKTFNPGTQNQQLNGYYAAGSVVAAVGGNAGAQQVLSGHVFSSANGINQTGTMPNNGGVGGQVTQQGQTAWIPAGYTSGGSVTANISNLTAGNILAGVNVGGVVGTGVNGKRFAYTAVTNPDKYNGKFYHELRGLPFKPDIVVGRYYNYFAQLQSEALDGRPNSLCFMWSLYTPDGDKMQKGSASTSPDFALYIDGYKILLCDYQKESFRARTWHVFAFE